MGISEKIAGRAIASELLALALESDLNTQDHLIGFYRQLSAECDSNLAALGQRNGSSGIEAMLTDEARQFEAREIDFGTYRGCTYGEVPIGYLTWLADEYMKLLRYIKSDLALQRIERADG